MTSDAGDVPTAQPEMLAVGFAAIVATSFCFVLRAFVIDDWGREFALSATEKGELLGVGLWPFAITIVLLSLFIDRIGFKATLWFAVTCHAVGLAVLLLAAGYWTLYVGTFILALGNGAVEAAANPLIATVFAHDKTKWLNRLHAGWPGGLILGGLLALLLGPEVGWRLKIAIMVVPVAIYAALLVGRRFPVSERVAHGVSYREMLAQAGFVSAFVIAALMMMEIGRVLDLPDVVTAAIIVAATLAYGLYARSPGRPLFLILMLLMIPLAITELSTDSWITSLMEPEMHRVGLQPGWVLVYMSGIMFGMRLIAGALIHRLSPFGLLACASVLAALGIWTMSWSAGMMILVAATLYAIGKSFFWGTSLGIAAEQYPKGGAATLNIMAGSGMLAAGIVGSVFLGNLQDRSAADILAATDAREGSHYSQTFLTRPHVSVFGAYQGLDEARVAAAPLDEQAMIGSVVGEAKKKALRGVAVLPLLMALSYLGLILYFRKRGGYRPANIA